MLTLKLDSKFSSSNSSLMSASLVSHNIKTPTLIVILYVLRFRYWRERSGDLNELISGNKND